MAAEEIARSPLADAATVWHSCEWAATVVAVYGFEDCSLRGHDGCLPLFLSRSPLRGTKLVSAVFNGIASPLAASDEARLALIARAAEIARERRVDWLEIKTAGSLPREALQELGVEARQPYWLDVLPLSVDRPLPDHVEAPFRKHLRRMTRRMCEAGVRITQSHEPRDLDEFHRLLVARNRDRFGTLSQPRSLLDEISRRFLASDTGRLFVARAPGGAMLAGALFLDNSRIASGFLSAASESSRHLSLDTLVKAEAARHYAQAGLSWLDLGVSSPAQPSVLAAKGRFGTQRTRSSCLVLPVRRPEVPEHDYAEIWPTARRLFRMVPLPVARRLPALLARYLN